MINLTIKELKELAKSVSCRYVKRDNSFKSSNFTFNLDTLEAVSYGWWTFSMKLSEDKVLFNRTCYSSTTVKHQQKASLILSALNISRFTLFDTRINMTNISISIGDNIKGLSNQCKTLQTLIDKKGSHRSTNEDRKELIVSMCIQALELDELKKQYTSQVV